MAEIWIILVSCCIAIACSMIGTILVLRRMAMLSDAISHAVLPGIVISYLLFNELDYSQFLVAAVLTAIITTLLIELVSKLAKYRRDVSMGMVYTLLFSIGIILISKNPEIPIQSDHVLQGNLEIIPIEKAIIVDGDLSLGPQPLWSAIANVMSILVFFVFGYRAMKLISFDEEFAKVNGINVKSWNLIFLIITSITVVISFNSVGAILVIGFIVIPPATAMILSNRFANVIALSALTGCVACIAGVYIAKHFDVSIAGTICLTMGAIFALVFCYDALKLKFASKHVIKA